MYLSNKCFARRRERRHGLADYVEVRIPLHVHLATGVGLETLHFNAVVSPNEGDASHIHAHKSRNRTDFTIHDSRNRGHPKFRAARLILQLPLMSPFRLVGEKISKLAGSTHLVSMGAEATTACRSFRSVSPLSMTFLETLA